MDDDGIEVSDPDWEVAWFVGALFVLLILFVLAAMCWGGG
jgi:hypothetical protein